MATQRRGVDDDSQRTEGERMEECEEPAHHLWEEVRNGGGPVHAHACVFTFTIYCELNSSFYYQSEVMFAGLHNRDG